MDSSGLLGTPDDEKVPVRSAQARVAGLGNARCQGAVTELGFFPLCFCVSLASQIRIKYGLPHAIIARGSQRVSKRY